MIDKVCREQVKVKRKDGSCYSISKLEAIMTQMTNQAASEDTKSARTLFQILNMFPEPKEPAPEQTPIYHIHFVDPPPRTLSQRGRKAAGRAAENYRRLALRGAAVLDNSIASSRCSSCE